MSKKINCIKCKFYKVTWDPKSPRGCSKFGFKSVKSPHIVVFESSGKDCMFFTEKK